ncbi:MAG: heme ABC transporter substrate-binding protein IsdE [Clostridia bacterium]
MKMLKLLFASIISLSFLTACAVAPETEKSEVNLDNIAVTSVAIMQICEAMDIDLVGVPNTDLAEIPEVYSSATEVGYAMAPDLEILAQLNPEIVLSPVSLISDLRPQYEAANLEYAFMNLSNIHGMFKSIEELGILLDKETEAQVLIDEYNAYYEEYQSLTENGDAPTVLILMGLPGSYVVATENSYVGSLVEVAGGINVYAGTNSDFLNVNTEDMLLQNPDIILRTAHALPDEVLKMFVEEFAENDIWKHFSAVENGEVYDLDSTVFGMSANFEYKTALETLKVIFYED